MDELRQSPRNIEAEQSVLGAMLLDSDCHATVINLLRPEDFYLRQNRDIFETMYSMFLNSQPIDPITLAARMKERGLSEGESISEYLIQLLNITPTAANVLHYARIVSDNSILRALLNASSGISESVYEGVGTTEQIVEAAERSIYAIRKGNSSDNLEHIGTVLVDVFSRLNELARSGSDIPGLPTGYMEFDRKIGGLNKTDLLIVAARPGMGKSSFALNIAAHVAKKTDKTVAFFSLEMSKVQLGMRLLSSEALVPNTKLTTGRLSEDEWGKLGLAASLISQTNIVLDDNAAVTVADMNAKCRRIGNLGLVIIDYLQLMQSAGGSSRGGENRVVVISEISRALKIMAKELEVPIICLSQLSRALESRQDKRPLLSDLRESGSIEQDADEVVFLFREGYYNADYEDPNLVECIVAKNRHGETGSFELQWMPEYTTFAEREWMRDG